MKILNIVFLLWMTCHHLQAQVQPEEFMNHMLGTFEWKMYKPLSHTIIRTGKRTSEPCFEGQLFMFRETFSDSDIEQVGFFGYDKEANQILSVGLYNVDMGPHILKGSLKKEKQGYQVIFIEDDKTIVLHIKNREYHYWEYYSKKGDVWSLDDLRIDFYRATAAPQ